MFCCKVGNEIKLEMNEKIAGLLKYRELDLSVYFIKLDVCCRLWKEIFMSVYSRMGDADCSKSPTRGSAKNLRGTNTPIDIINHHWVDMMS